MEIEIINLKFKNFKGLKDYSLNFSENVTTISGENASGKTTIFDGYCWLLYGKDSFNRKDCDIKPYDIDGENIHNVETSVEGAFLFNDKEVKLKRIYKEIWKKKRGSNTKEFSGHTTDFYINEVPKKKKEYEEFISEYINEEEFNLLSNPLYFNEIIDKSERRNILLSLVDDVSTDDVVKENKELKELDLEQYAIEELQAMSKSKTKKINEKLKEIPARIDELNSTKVDEDFKELEDEKEKIVKEIEDIDRELAGNKNVSEELDKKYKSIAELKEEFNAINSDYEESKKNNIQKFENKHTEIQRKIDACTFEITNTIDRINSLENRIEEKEKLINDVNKELEQMRKDWVDISTKKFDGSLNCPTCGREFEEDKKQEILSNFNIHKSNEIEKMEKKGFERKDKIESYQSNIKEFETEKENLLSQEKKLKDKKEKLKEEELTVLEIIERAKALKIMPSLIKRQEEIKKEIESIEESIKNIDKKDNTQLLEQKRVLNQKLDEINTKVLGIGFNVKIDTKIEEYEQEEKKLSAEYEEAQKILYLCDEYTKTYVDLVSSKVNNFFTFVKFKLFDTQINGGIQETAEATFKGVPYGVLNNAAKINAGLDVINALSQKYEKQIPIFVDNAEAINELTEVDSQLVRLVVSKDEELIVED
ncbi:AAA family ATPase [Anaerococcus sp. AGMB00486]|uniref:Nuclease SbcCD subunit C n=2 Tax=Anaerococcus TaxID=165779 RepID=A0ABX2N7Y6_9FIRM|nr:MULTISPECIES: AAA family ATPase [Anaerococcus]MSS77404.1 AAA family ATPase [Anaerococcus porci]NVF10794.1 AAA family ATPase [Anaerococcus faecalis]